MMGLRSAAAVLAAASLAFAPGLGFVGAALADGPPAPAPDEGQQPFLDFHQNLTSMLNAYGRAQTSAGYAPGSDDSVNWPAERNQLRDYMNGPMGFRDVNADALLQSISRMPRTNADEIRRRNDMIMALATMIYTRTADGMPPGVPRSRSDLRGKAYEEWRRERPTDNANDMQAYLNYLASLGPDRLAELRGHRHTITARVPSAPGLSTPRPDDDAAIPGPPPGQGRFNWRMDRHDSREFIPTEIFGDTGQVSGYRSPHVHVFGGSYASLNIVNVAAQGPYAPNQTTEMISLVSWTGMDNDGRPRGAHALRVALDDPELAAGKSMTVGGVHYHLRMVDGQLSLTSGGRSGAAADTISSVQGLRDYNIARWRDYNYQVKLNGQTYFLGVQVHGAQQDLVFYKPDGTVAFVTTVSRYDKAKKGVPGYRGDIEQEAHMGFVGGDATNWKILKMGEDGRYHVANGTRPPRPEPPPGSTAGGSTAAGSTAAGSTATGAGADQLPEGFSFDERLNSQLPAAWTQGGTLRFLRAGDRLAIRMNLRGPNGQQFTPNIPITYVRGAAPARDEVEIRNIGGRVYVAASADLNGSRTVNFTDLTLLAEQMRVVPSQTESGQFNLDSEVLTRSNAGGFNFGDKTTTSAIKDYNLFIHVLTQAGLPSGIEQAVGTLLNTSRFSGGSIFGSSVPPRITMQTTDNRTVSLEHRDGAWTQPDAERDNALGGTMPGATGRNGGASRIVMDPRNGTRFTDAEALTELARTNWRFQSDGNDLPTTRVEGVGGTRAALFRVQDGDQIYYVVRYLEAVTADRTTVRVLRLPVTATNGAGVTVTDLPWPTGDRLTRLQPLFNTHTRTFLVPIPGTNASSGGWVAFVGDPGGNLESPSGGAICRGVVVSWGSPTIPTPCR